MPDEQDFAAQLTGMGSPVSPQRGAGQSSIIGARELQSAVDDLQKTVRDLKDTVTKIAGMSGGGRQGFSGGGVSRQQTTNGSGFANIIPGLFHAVYGKDHLGNNPHANLGNKYAGFNNQSHTAGGGGQGFSAMYGLGGSSGGYSGGSGSNAGGQTGGGGTSGGGNLAWARQQLGGGGPGGTPPTTPGFGGTPHNNGGGSSFGGLGNANTYRTGGFLAMVSSISSFGAANFSTQVGMNAYTRQQQMAGMSNQQARYLAYGANGRNINTLAQSPGDASAGQSLINAYGNYNPGSGQFRFAQGAANQFGISNPGMSYQDSAAMASQLGSPSTALRMTMLGMTPALRMGGGTNGSGAVFGGMMNRIMGSQHVSQRTFNASIANPTSVGYADLSNAFGAQNAGSYVNALQSYNRLSGKYNQSQITTMFNQAARGNKSALGTLSKNGIGETDLQKIQQAQGVSTATQGDISQSFSSGLSAATTSLTAFRTVLEKIVNIPGVNQAVGGTAGFTGTLRNLSNPEHLLGGVGGAATMMAATQLASKFGGGMMSTSMAVAAGATPVAVVAGNTSGIGGSAATGAASKAAGGAAVGDAEGVAAGGVAGKAASAKSFISDNGAQIIGSLIGAAVLNSLTNKIASVGKKFGPNLNPKGIIGGALSGLGAANPELAAPMSFLTGSNALTNPGEKPPSGSNPIGKIAGMISHLGGAAASSSQSSTTGGKQTASVSKASGEATSAISWADKQVGKPYVWGGLGPDGFDCSGLVYEAYLHAGLKGLPRTSQAQWSWLEKNKRTVNPNQAKPGDLVFKAGSDGTADSPGHVAMVQGGGNIVEAQQTGVPIHVRKYNPGEWNHAGRPTGAAGSGGTNGSSSGSSGTNAGTPSATGGNSGAGSLSSTSEADNVSAALGMGVGSAGGGSSAALTSNTSGGKSSGSTNGSSGGTSSKGKMSAAQIANLWKSQGGPSGAATNMAKIAFAESGDVPSVIQKGQPPGLTGYGLYQITPTSGISQNGKFGNLLNAANNTKAAISLYKASGYSPWTSDPVGASLTGKATGGAARDQAFIVGERGPEVFDPKNQHVTDAKRTAQLQSKKTNSQVTSPFQTALANQGQNTSGGGVTVQLNFKENSIVFKTGSNGARISKDDASHSVQELIRQLQTQLNNQKVYAAIQNGNH